MIARGIKPDITDLTATVTVVESLRLDDELQEIKDILKIKKLKESRSVLRNSTKIDATEVSDASDPSAISISPGEFDKHINPERMKKKLKARRIKKQQRYHKIVERSNKKIVEYLKNNLECALDGEGVDIYTYFNFIGELKEETPENVVEKSRKCKRILVELPSKFYKFYTAIIVIAIQLVVPCILLASQLSNAKFQPTVNNIWFRFVGFLVMSYSTADLRNQIIDQVNWVMIDNNKILKRINKSIKRPNIIWLYIGLYTNMIMSIVVTTNIYLLYCSSDTIIDLILNTVALNFLLLIDNSAFSMLVGNKDVMEIIKTRATEQIETMQERANFYEIRIIRRMHPTLEYYFFYAVSIYTLILPFVFLFYNAEDITLELSE